jgi:DHA2 family methylenomycin A resistance protein-like MFS transporter
MSAPPPVVWELSGPVLGGLAGLYLLGVTAGPRMTAGVAMDLDLTASTMVWVSAAYLVAAMLTAPAGVMLGRRAPNAVAATAAGLLFLGSVVDALAGDHVMLMAGRVVSGLGAGALIAYAVMLTRDAGRPWAYVVGGLGAFALVLGPVLGGGLAAALTWRSAFLVALPPLILAVLASVIRGITSAARRPANH